MRRMAIENALIICLAISREVYSILNCSEEKERMQILQMPKKKDAYEIVSHLTNILDITLTNKTKKIQTKKQQFKLISIYFISVFTALKII